MIRILLCDDDQASLAVLNDLQIAETVIFDSVLTETQINDLYSRAQSRMLARGITI